MSYLSVIGRTKREVISTVLYAGRYIHGEGSLASSIIKLAQSFTGQANLPILCEEGAFGSRTQNGKDHASPRKFGKYLIC